MPVRQAWQQALYGRDGFYRRQHPRAHFRTSPHASPLFARAIAELARRVGARSIWDLGAGDGELLAQLHDIDSGLQLTGVEIRPRPAGLPTVVGWLTQAPDEYDGLLVANEWLDNTPCEVVERDEDGRWRRVEVDLGSGRERLAEPPTESELRWLETWWPSTDTGQRAEVGLARDQAWEAICARNATGTCLAVDFGHRRDSRPLAGSLTAYRGGAQVDVRFDRSCDVTAAVAVDAVAAATGARLCTQRDALAELGVTAARPPLETARTDPDAYVRALARATQAAELTAPSGLGGFSWLLTARGR
jgi:SAM-dependent MidA family methyltransferase